MRKKSLLPCLLLLAGTARGDNPLPRILCNGVFQGFPASLNFQGATCTGIGGINAITVSPGTGPAGPAGPTGATGPAGPAGAPGGGAPTGATYITQVPDGTLSAEQAMSLLTTGLVKSTTATGVLSIYAGTSCAYAIQALDASGAASTCRAAPTIPTDLSAEPFITKTASANLSNEFALGSLANGLLLNATTTGVPTIYAGTSCPYAVKTLDVSGASTCTAAPTIPTDISAASYWTRVSEANLSSETALGSLATGAILNTGVTGVPTIYAGTSCTNQFNRSLNASIAATCSGVGVADFTPNQGTTTQVLHGNAAGQPAWGAVVDVDITPAYSGTGACGAGLFASTLNRAAAPTCTAPSGPAKLCGARLGSALATTGAITCTAAESFWCDVNITNYGGGGDIASFRFNADATAGNYHARHINFSNAATPVLTSNNFTTGGNIQLGPTAITVGRRVQVSCSNVSSSRKICIIRQQEEAAAQATLAQMELGYGEWFNTAAQITSIEMRTNAGQTMGIASSFLCYGGTPP